MFKFFVFSLVSANVPFFTNDPSLQSVNFVSKFNCSEQILFTHYSLANSLPYFVPYSTLTTESYSESCPNNPIYSQLPDSVIGPFLLVNATPESFSGKIIYALESHILVRFYSINNLDSAEETGAPTNLCSVFTEISFSKVCVLQYCDILVFSDCRYLTDNSIL